jgi:hypothetical protein
LRSEIELAEFSGDDLKGLSSWSLYRPRPAFCSSFLPVKLTNERSNSGRGCGQSTNERNNGRGGIEADE